jgi:NAD(P)-dependent dehydrogenase (short-subunit alcohol dehydrogenase family)
MARRAQIIPLGRLGRPAEVASTIVFLLAAESDYITGQVITIDGGEVMP